MFSLFALLISQLLGQLPYSSIYTCPLHSRASGWKLYKMIHWRMQMAANCSWSSFVASSAKRTFSSGSTVNGINSCLTTSTTMTTTAARNWWRTKRSRSTTSSSHRTLQDRQMLQICMYMLVQKISLYRWWSQKIHSFQNMLLLLGS